MQKHKNNKKLTLAMAFVLGCCVFGAGDAFAEEAATRGELAFDLEGITVEAARPDWETKLSPGSVTVIRPDDYKGEQKTLPDLMRKVPGVHVREVNGKGQYTTVTVRGSTAAQVGVFIDGVLSNLGGDSAVDLSTIPVANVERIEVYRGYIPARFAGTFIGGVINIVTKKPEKAKVGVELGKSSYGGKKGAAEITAPLGDGSLMFGTNYESSDGDFAYDNYAAKGNIERISGLIANAQSKLDGFYADSVSKYADVLGDKQGYKDAVNSVNAALADETIAQANKYDAWKDYVNNGGFAADCRENVTSKLSTTFTEGNVINSGTMDLYKEAHPTDWYEKFREDYGKIQSGNISGVDSNIINHFVDNEVKKEVNSTDITQNKEMVGYQETVDKEKKNLEAAKNPKRWRQYNDYENINSILKWQNDEWMVKAAWNKIDRHLPDSLWNGAFSDAPVSFPVDLYDTYGYDSRRQKIDTKELMLQNRQNVGDLEWGWMIDYTQSDKEYRAENVHDNLITEQDKLIPLRKWSEYKSDKYNAQIDGTYKISDNNMLDFQLNYSNEEMNIKGDNLDRELSHQELTTVAGQIRNRYEQEMINLQIQDTITLDDKDSWFLTPSVKYNRSTITGYSEGKRFQDLANKQFGWINPKDEQTDDKVTWQLALKKEFNDNFTMRMTGGTYYRLLNMYEIAGDGAGILPAPNTSGRESSFPFPEEGKQFDISALWHGETLGGYNKTSLTYFWRDSDNMLQLQRMGKDYWSYMNDNRGTARGIELQTNFNWNKFDVDLQATYTKSDMQRKNSSGAYDWTDIWATYQPEWEGNVRLTYRPVNNLDIFAEAHYTDMYYTRSVKEEGLAYDSGMPVDDLLVFNTGIKWKMKDRWQLAVGCNDVFNKGPEQMIAYGNGTYINPEFPVQGRTYYATLKCEF